MAIVAKHDFALKLFWNILKLELYYINGKKFLTVKSLHLHVDHDRYVNDKQCINYKPL